VTAVGEVPAQTVQLIAHSTKPDVDAATAGRR
jgi:negative regulator of sigma E activity